MYWCFIYSCNLLIYEDSRGFKELLPLQSKNNATSLASIFVLIAFSSLQAFFISLEILRKKKQKYIQRHFPLRSSSQNIFPKIPLHFAAI